MNFLSGHTSAVYRTICTKFGVCGKKIGFAGPANRQKFPSTKTTKLKMADDGQNDKKWLNRVFAD